MNVLISPQRPLRRALYCTLAAAVALPLALQAAGLGRGRQAATRTLSHGFAVIPLAAEVLRPAERSFLAKAVETARQQVRLAEVGAGNADSSEVRSHALQLVADYRQLNDTLDALIRRKGGIAGAPVGGTSETYQQLTERTGSDFDREFVKAAATLTDGTMNLFEQAAADSRDTDVRELAAAQLPLLRGHRNRITELKKSVN